MNISSILSQPSTSAGVGLLYTGIQSLAVHDWVGGAVQVVFGILAIVLPEAGAGIKSAANRL